MIFATFLLRVAELRTCRPHGGFDSACMHCPFDSSVGFEKVGDRTRRAATGLR